MIQKIFITFFIIVLVLYGYRLFKRFFPQSSVKKSNDENIIDLEKDPKTNEYKPKD
tara:strand:+ start:182 stop:349 length:168 start_codon:yes stop_codon:yes gene_type:complete